MKALLLFWHGIGDLLCCTPALRGLHAKGYHCDIMVLPYVKKSGVMDACPYVSAIALPGTVSPSVGKEKGRKARQEYEAFAKAVVGEYDAFFEFSRDPEHIRGGKIARNLRSCKLPPTTDPATEVFIPQSSELEAQAFRAEYLSGDYIFRHTMPGHRNHWWKESDEWIANNLPALPILEIRPRYIKGAERMMLVDSVEVPMFENINTAFVLAREANHRVIASSVFAHACDAMNSVMDACYYGGPAAHALPLDPNMIKTYHGAGEEMKNVKSIL